MGLVELADIKLFNIKSGVAAEIKAGSMALERSLQHLFEANLETLLGVKVLASEYAISEGRMDTLGIDENGCPVVIEYKRHSNENIINQGLFYLDWLINHRDSFKILTLDRLGKEAASKIDWSLPRLICIAADFNKYDESAVKQMSRSIDLIRYRMFGEDLLMLDHIASSTGSAQQSNSSQSDGNKSPAPKSNKVSVTEQLKSADDELTKLYSDFLDFINSLGDDIQSRQLQMYIAFARLRNFVCLEVRRQRGIVLLYLSLDPNDIRLEEGFTRDMRGIGHYGTGDVEVIISSSATLERAKPLIKAAYEKS